MMRKPGHSHVLPVNAQAMLLPSLSIHPSHGTTHHPSPWPQGRITSRPDPRLLLGRVLSLGHLTHWNVSSKSTVTILHCLMRNDGESTTPLIGSSFLLFKKNAYLDKL